MMFDNRYIAEPNSGCWLWLGSLFKNGYAQATTRVGGTRLAHRQSWLENHGPIPDEVLVLHKCDVRCCINPDHLFLGTHTDNLNDMVRKGRANPVSLPGEAHGLSKLTNADVVAIRSDPRPDRAVAKDYGIWHGQVWRIRNGKQWRHIT